MSITISDLQAEGLSPEASARLLDRINKEAESSRAAAPVTVGADSASALEIERLKAAMASREAAYNSRLTEIAAVLKETNYRSAVNEELYKLGAIDPWIVGRLLDSKKIEVTGGRAKGVREQVAELREQAPYLAALFRDSQQQQSAAQQQAPAAQKQQQQAPAVPKKTADPADAVQWLTPAAPGQPMVVQQQELQPAPREKTLDDELDELLNAARSRIKAQKSV